MSYETVRRWVKIRAADSPPTCKASPEASHDLASRRECAAYAPPAMEVRRCIEDEGGPLGADRQGWASNHRKLRR